MRGSYLLQRTLYAVFVIATVSVVVFVLVRLTGDPAVLMAPPNSTKEDIDLLRHQLGFDAPLHVQYVRYVGGLLRLDFGQSVRFSTPVAELILQRLPATLQLAVASMVIGVMIGVSVGLVSAVYRNTWIDYAGRTVGLVGQAVPVYWSGIMLIIVFGVLLRWLPVSGQQGWQSLILPALTVGTYMAAGIMRLVRSSVLEVLGQDYIRSARAKGLSEGLVISRHALRNALLPVSTMVGLQLGLLLSGAVLTETIFAWPGLGQLSVQAVFARDFPLIQGIVLISAVFLVVVNLVVDVAYAYIDPRIRYG